MSGERPVVVPYKRVERRRVLHVGCGRLSAHRLHATFEANDGWQEIRLDIDAKVEPDIVCSIVNMSASVPTGSVDAVWSSHAIEHLYDHDVVAAFREFRRVLRSSGFLLLRCPDLESVAEQLLNRGVEQIAYESPAGPVTPLDILYGHRPSISAGTLFMAHHTGFTDERLGRMLLQAGFSEARTRRDGFDLWAVAFVAPNLNDPCLDTLSMHGLDFES